MTVLRSVVLGCGSYLPARILSNDELAKAVETTDEWIVQRTGIRERHIAAAGELTSDLALHAARAALANAHVEAASIDLIVLATSTPDQTFPATAVSVQAGLGITILPSSAKEIDAYPMIRSRRIEAAGFERQISLVKKSGRTLPPLSALFVSHLRETATG